MLYPIELWVRFFAGQHSLFGLLVRRNTPIPQDCTGFPLLLKGCFPIRDPNGPVRSVYLGFAAHPRSHETPRFCLELELASRLHAKSGAIGAERAQGGRVGVATNHLLVMPYSLPSTANWWKKCLTESWFFSNQSMLGS
jgi:hypothetical protein